MSRERITLSGDSAAMRLPREILEVMGVAIGDEVEISIVERALIVRSLDEAERAQQFETASRDVFHDRKSAYEELAKGAD